MSPLVHASSGDLPSSVVRLPPRSRTPLLAALTVAIVYYLGSRIGIALTTPPMPMSVLWPPNALLFAALVLVPTRWWWLLVAAVFPAHLAAQLPGSVPTAMVLCWFVSNVAEALIGAAFVRWLAGPSPGLSSVRSVVVFCGAAVLAPFLSSFLDAAFVRLVGFGQATYWSLWLARLPSNMLSTFVFVPVAMALAVVEIPLARGVSRARMVEGGVLLGGLLLVSVLAFDTDITSAGSPSLLYLPMPFLIWAALRFGPPLTSVSFMVVAFLVIWGAGHGQGPFMHPASSAEALPIQLFLITIAVPLLLLAAVIEERRVAEQRLRASENLFATAFRSSPDAIAISRRSDGRIIAANDRWLDLTGYRRDELARGGVAPLHHHLGDADRAKVAALAHDVGDILRDVEVSLRDCRGHVHPTLVRMRAVDLHGEACEITIARDVSAQRQAEALEREQRLQLTHLTRVASLTEFSSTLAHELNQPLTAILANAQAALRFLARDPGNVEEVRSILHEIVEADKRAGELIHHLRLLMKKGSEEFVPIDLNLVVRHVLELLHGEFVTRDVDVRISLADDLPPVNGDRVQLQQVVMNLASNACDAMRQPGCSVRVLSVATGRGADGGVQVSVSDTGPGIAAGQLDHIFEPFFTTKDAGLGLGLPISRRIAREHGGVLVAEQREVGACFRLSLPTAKQRPRSDDAMAPPQHRSRVA